MKTFEMPIKNKYEIWQMVIAGNVQYWKFMEYSRNEWMDRNFTRLALELQRSMQESQ